MALFLQESVVSNEGGMQTLVEAFEALLEMTDAHALLTESTLIADYVLESTSKNLSEAEQEDGKKGFMKKTWEKIKAFAQTVWAKIKQIARLIARKAKEIFTKVLAKFKGEEGTVSKRNQVLMEGRPAILEKMLFLAEKGVTSSSAEDYEKALAQVQADYAKLKDAAKGDERVPMKKSVFEGHVKAVEGLAKKVEAAINEQASALKKLEAEGSSESLTKASKMLASLRQSANALTNHVSQMSSAWKPTEAAQA